MFLTFIIYFVFPTPLNNFQKNLMRRGFHGHLEQMMLKVPNSDPCWQLNTTDESNAAFMSCGNEGCHTVNTLVVDVSTSMLTVLA